MWDRGVESRDTPGGNPVDSELKQMSGRVPVCRSIVPLPLENAITLRIVRLRNLQTVVCPPCGDIPRSGTRPATRRSSPSGATFESSAARRVWAPTVPPRPARSRNHTLDRVTPIGFRYLGLPVARRLGEQRGGNGGTHGSILDGGVTLGDCVHGTASASVILKHIALAESATSGKQQQTAAKP
jgi:hypothetical protein